VTRKIIGLLSAFFGLFFVSASMLLCEQTQESKHPLAIELNIIPQSSQDSTGTNELGPLLKGFDLGIMAELGTHFGLRFFGEVEHDSYYYNPAADALGGGLGLRWYFRSLDLSGPFLELNGLALNVNEPIVPGIAYDYTLFGGGLSAAWQFVLSRHWLITPSVELEELYVDTPGLWGGIKSTDGAVRLGPRLSLGWLW
jgi:hypothetical protein